MLGRLLLGIGRLLGNPTCKENVWTFEGDATIFWLVGYTIISDIYLPIDEMTRPISCAEYGVRKVRILPKILTQIWGLMTSPSAQVDLGKGMWEQALHHLPNFSMR